MVVTQIAMEVIRTIPENKLIFVGELYEKLRNRGVSRATCCEMIEYMHRSGILCRVEAGIYYRPKKSKYETTENFV